MNQTVNLKLPPYWAAKESRSQPGRIYYINYKTRKSTWIHPGEVNSDKKDGKNKTANKPPSGKGKFTTSTWSPAPGGPSSSTLKDGSPKKKECPEPVKTLDLLPRRILLAKRRIPKPSAIFEPDVEENVEDEAKNFQEEKKRNDHEADLIPGTSKCSKFDEASDVMTQQILIAKKRSDVNISVKNSSSGKGKTCRVLPKTEGIPQKSSKDDDVDQKWTQPSGSSKHKLPNRSKNLERAAAELEQCEVKEPVQPKPIHERKVAIPKRNLPKVRTSGPECSHLEDSKNIHKTETKDPCHLPSQRPRRRRKASRSKQVPYSSPQNRTSAPHTDTKGPEIQNNNSLKSPSSFNFSFKMPLVDYPTNNLPSQTPPLISPPEKSQFQSPTCGPAPSTSSDSHPSSSRLLLQPPSTPIPTPERNRQIFIPLNTPDLHTVTTSSPPLSGSSPAPDDKDIEVDMEVEELDPSLLSDLCEVRRSISTEKTQSQDVGFPEFFFVDKESGRDNVSLSSSSDRKINIVVDTNVLMHDLKVIDRLKDETFPDYGRPNLVVPWVVMQELDCLKNGRNGKMAVETKLLARHPVNFLHECLKSKHPRILCQTPMEERALEGVDLKVECNDDRILRCCLQWKQKCPEADMVLLTMDKNLRNKAMIAGITPHNTQSLLALLSGESQGKKLRKSDATGTPLSTSSPDTETIDMEERLADDIYCEIKSLMRDCLALVLETEMRRVYDELWEKIVFIKPPWELHDLLSCLKKHMIAVFGEMIPRKDQDIVDYLRNQFKPGAHITSLFDIKMTVSSCGSLLQHLKGWNAHDGFLQKTDDKLKILYKVAKDVDDKTETPGRLLDLKRKYEEPLIASQSCTPAESQDTPENVTAHVMSVFQTAWENVLFCQNHLETNLLSSNAEQRSKYVTFLGKIVKALLNTSNAYSMYHLLGGKQADIVNQIVVICIMTDKGDKWREGMLAFKESDEPSHCRLVLHELCSSIDIVARIACIQPWTPMNPAWLESYLTISKSHEVLSTGFTQLQGFIMCYHKVWQQLTPEEQALASL